MTKAGLSGMLGALACAWVVAAVAADPKIAEIAEKLNVPVEAVAPSPVPGLYEVRIAHDFDYVTADGAYLLQGDLVNLKSGEEITEEHRRTDRIEALRGLPLEDYITFAPAAPRKTRWTVTVFTDVDCHYCRLLHSQVQSYNDDGIAIRYAAYPRTGPNSPSFEKAEQVWCSPDRNKALTAAKLDRSVPGDTKCANPVMKEFTLGRDLGLRGTPMIVLPDGDRIDGYRSPEELVKLLQDMGTDNVVKVSLDH